MYRQRRFDYYQFAVGLGQWSVLSYLEAQPPPTLQLWLHISHTGPSRKSDPIVLPSQWLGTAGLAICRKKDLAGEGRAHSTRHRTTQCPLKSVESKRCRSTFTGPVRPPQLRVGRSSGPAYCVATVVCPLYGGHNCDSTSIPRPFDGCSTTVRLLIKGH